jgi:SAM-dependent methyltransferase
MEAETVAARVQAFYERHPYPPPASNLASYRDLWRDPEKRRADFHLVWPRRAYREDHAILIAGCGTSQAAKHALRWPAARVTGIDFSATSVRHTEALKQKHEIDNLQVRQLPVERARDLGTRFDQIVCTGVLHHLADPRAGLEALRDVLAPGGAMHLMVYAPHGRTGVYMLQEFCRRVGIAATEEGLSGLAAALEALPPGHPLELLLREAPDFRTPAALADALLHPQDRAYSVPQLLALLAETGLSFGRWLWQAHYDPGCGVMARIPQAAQLAALAPAEQYAAVELFRGTMLRHSVVVHAGDSEGSSRELSFAGDGWRHYVPLRRPDTIAVMERLSPGVAAVLINRGHTYRDIYLPLDAREKRLFDGIDGKREIAEITRLASPDEDVGIARALFERLYRHDQIAFDASGSARTPG